MRKEKHRPYNLEENWPTVKTRIVLPKPVWNALVEENNHDLLTKLHHAEIQTPGFGTIVVPSSGFSEDDHVHNAVLNWMEEHNVTALNPSLEITRLQYALHGANSLE